MNGTVEESNVKSRWMGVDQPVPSTRQRLVLCVACLSLVLLAVLVVQNRGLWAPDELRYAQVVQGMGHATAWFVPQLWGDTYTQKPPLYFWLVRAVAPLTNGVRLVSLLVPIVLAACGLLWLSGRVAAAWYGSRVGSRTIIVLATLPLFLLMSLIGRMDMLLALFVTAAVYSFFLGYVEGVAWAKVAGFVWMGLGVLAKGPFGVMFPLLVAVTALALTGKAGRLRCRETVLGIAALFGLLAVWLVPAVWMQGTEYLGELLGPQIIGRAVDGLSHGEPPYFYLWMLPIVLLPWMVCFVPALRTCWKQWKQEHKDRELWLLCWFGVPLVLLSLVREKLPVYLLPAMPPIAILLARYWTGLTAGRESSTSMPLRLASLYAAVVVLGLTTLLSGLLTVGGPTDTVAYRVVERAREAIEGEILGTLLSSPVLMAGGAVFFVLGLFGSFSLLAGDDRRLRLAFGTLAAVAPCGQLFLTLAIMPRIDGTQSWRAVAESLAEGRQLGEPVAACGMRPYFAYYLNGEIASFPRPESLASFVQTRGPVWCAMYEKELKKISRYCVVDDASIGKLPGQVEPIYVVRVEPRWLAEKNDR